MVNHGHCRIIPKHLVAFGNSQTLLLFSADLTKSLVLFYHCYKNPSEKFCNLGGEGKTVNSNHDFVCAQIFSF